LQAAKSPRLRISALAFALILSSLTALFAGEGLNFGHQIQPNYLLLAAAFAVAGISLTAFALRSLVPRNRVVIGLALIPACFAALLLVRLVVLRVEEHNAAEAARPSVDAVTPYPGASIRGYNINREHNQNFSDDFWDTHEWYRLTRTDEIPPGTPLASVATHYTGELRKTGCEFGPVTRANALADSIAAGGFSCALSSRLGGASVEVRREEDHLMVAVSAMP
jgi:hypothetical protein